MEILTLNLYETRIMIAWSIVSSFCSPDLRLNVSYVIIIGTGIVIVLFP